MNVFVLVLQRRETLSLGPRPGKTAQKPLKFCLKNRSKITARNERFLKQDLSGLSGFSKKTARTAQTAQTAQILLENRSNLERFLSGISTRVMFVLDCWTHLLRYCFLPHILPRPHCSFSLCCRREKRM